MTSRRGRLALVLVLVTACGHDDSPVVDAGAPVPTPAAQDAGGGVAGSTTAPPGDREGAAVTVDGTPGGGDAPPTGGATPAPATPGFPDLDANVAVGAFAPAVLRPDQSHRVVVEVQAADGAAPRQATLDHVRAVLQAVTGKEVVLAGGGAPPAAGSWTPASIRSAADAGARTAQGGGTAVLRVLFLPGSFEGDDGVLGIAVRGDVAAVFVDRAAEAGGSLLGDDGRIEVAIATHELGHLLGLVDLVLDTGRADPEHPHHSPNRDSVMYYAVEHGDALGLVFGPNPPVDFDAADRADLAAIAGG